MPRTSAADRLPVLPLRDTVLFPHVVMPLLVGRPGSLAAVLEAEERARTEGKPVRLLLVAQKDAECAEPATRDLYRVGTIVRVVQQARLPNGTVRLLVEGTTRARVSRYASSGPMLRATVEPLGFPPDDAPAGELEARGRRVAGLFEEYVAQSRRLPAELVPLLAESGTAEQRAFGMAAHLPLRQAERQRLLEAASLPLLFDGLSSALSGELELLGLERKIEQTVRGSLFRNQREFYLQEQLKAIHRELEGGDGDELDDLEARITDRGLPEVVLARAQRELRRLRRTPVQSPEHAVARNF